MMRGALVLSCSLVGLGGLVGAAGGDEKALCVAVGDVLALEDDVDGGLELDAVAVGRHGLVVGVFGVLAIDDSGHLPQRRHDLM